VLVELLALVYKQGMVHGSCQAGWRRALWAWRCQHVMYALCLVSATVISHWRQLVSHDNNGKFGGVTVVCIVFACEGLDV